MAEMVNAFKSKYSGEQIEELFDMLSSGSSFEPQAGEGQYYSVEDTSTVFEGNNAFQYKKGILTFKINGTGDSTNATKHPIILLRTDLINTNGSYFRYLDVTLEYTFDVPIIPKQLRIRVGSYDWSGTIYYCINGEWQLINTLNFKQNTALTFEFIQPEQAITGIKISFPRLSYGWQNIYYSIIDFESDSYVTGMTIKDGTL